MKQMKTSHSIGNLKDATKVVFRGKFRAVNAYIENEESSRINNLNYFKILEKEEQNKLKANRRKKTRLEWKETDRD